MDDKKKILEMIISGKITAEEGARLMEALNPEPKPAQKGKKLVIQILQEGAEKPKLNIAIPLKLAKLGLSFIPKNAQFKTNLSNNDIDLSSINWQEILSLATAGEMGELFYMEVEDENNKPLIIKVLVQ
jgi:SHOCT-like protein